MASKLKALIKKYIPHPSKIKNDRSLHIFRHFIQDPYLWHLNRYSVSTGFSVGLLTAFLPLPFQMILAAALAIIVRANLPIAVALTWVTNPITTPAISYFAYRIGAYILHSPPYEFKFEFSMHWLLSQFSSIGTPFVVGSVICGIIAGILGNAMIRLLWRYTVVIAWKTRFKRYQARRRKKERRRKKKTENP